MHIFLTCASEQKPAAEAIAFALRNKDDLPPGRSYDEQIEKAVTTADYLIFLISPQSVQQGRYARTELDVRTAEMAQSGRTYPAGHGHAHRHGEGSRIPPRGDDTRPQGKYRCRGRILRHNDPQPCTQDLVLWFAGAGLASGLLSAFLPVVPGARILEPVGFGAPIYPGSLFRIGSLQCALCSARGIPG
jgi:hypothetical protein